MVGTHLAQDHNCMYIGQRGCHSLTQFCLKHNTRWTDPTIHCSVQYGSSPCPPYWQFPHIHAPLNPGDNPNCDTLVVVQWRTHSVARLRTGSVSLFRHCKVLQITRSSGVPVELLQAGTHWFTALENISSRPSQALRPPSKRRSPNSRAQYSRMYWRTSVVILHKGSSYLGQMQSQRWQCRQQTAAVLLWAASS